MKEVFSVAVIILSSVICTYQQEGTTENGELKLELVQVLYRHGDRNPIDLYPNDPYKNESYWPEGFSQLSKKGKQQHYALGKFFRRRYAHFLSDAYTPKEIRVEASDVDRTLMSAEADLAGLYPPTPEEPWTVWNDKIPWQPIPVHTKPGEYDNTLRMQAPCPKLQRLIEEFNSGPVMQAIYAENKDLFQYLQNHTGKPIKTLQDVDYLYDALFIENLHNFTLPEWTKKVFPGGQFLNLTSISFRVLTWTQEMKRLKAGPLVNQIVTRFNLKANGSEAMNKSMKMFMYSAHDTTVASLLNALGMFNGLAPPYATAVIMELRQNATSGQHFVEFYYRNDSNHYPYLLTLPGCKFSCPLEDFVRLTKPVIPEDWGEECKLGFFGLDGIPLAALILGMFLMVLLLVSMVAFGLARRNQGNRPGYPYLHLQMEDEEIQDA